MRSVKFSRLLRAACVLCALAAPLAAFACRSPEKHSVERQIVASGLERTYLLHVPPNVSQPAPLVIVLHGGSGTGVQMERMSGFSALSDRDGFIVAYPDGLGRNWYDGRAFDRSEAHRERRDDVAFIDAMIDEISRTHAIDPDRIFATGISNGGFFSNYLGAKLSHRIAAIAPVVGGIADPFHKEFKPERPVAVLMIQGTDDPLVPYGAGEIAFHRGSKISTDDAIKLWCASNGCTGDPVVDTLQNLDPADGCIVRRWTWKGHAEVQLLVMQGGGHTWPGGPQYLSPAIVGPVCRDFDSNYIWDFFKAHPRR
jgi:polyhydroxybutyrate depolymerase